MFLSHQLTASKAKSFGDIGRLITFHIALTHNILVYPPPPNTTTTTLKKNNNKTKNKKHKHCFAFFCDNCHTHEKLKTILVQSLEVNEVYYNSPLFMDNELKQKSVLAINQYSTFLFQDFLCFLALIIQAQQLSQLM